MPPRAADAAFRRGVRPRAVQGHVRPVRSQGGEAQGGGGRGPGPGGWGYGVEVALSCLSSDLCPAREASAGRIEQEAGRKGSIR